MDTLVEDRTSKTTVMVFFQDTKITSSPLLGHGETVDGIIHLTWSFPRHSGENLSLMKKNYSISATRPPHLKQPTLRFIRKATLTNLAHGNYSSVITLPIRYQPIVSKFKQLNSFHGYTTYGKFTTPYLDILLMSSAAPSSTYETRKEISATVRTQSRAGKSQYLLINELHEH